MSLSQELHDFLGTTTVLVIEPNANFKTSIKNFLSNLKIKSIRITGSVGEARREMLTIKVGLFICEWQLPEKNGLIFCRELRREKAHRTTPFLLLSTENLRKDVILASEGGVDGYLLKPFSYEDFCSQLQALLTQAKNPNPVNAMLDRAETHLEQSEYWVAESLLKEAIALKPNSARAMTGLGRIHLGLRDYKQAMDAFRKATESNPEYVDGYKYMLQIAEERNDIMSMLQTATVLHSLSPDNPKYPLMIARAHMDLGNLSDSETFFKLTVRLSPTLADGFKGLGTVYMQKKEYDKAMKALEKALDLEKGDIPTLNSLGLSYVKQGMIDVGIRRYKLALAIDAHDARVLFNLGLAFEEKGSLPQAKDCFQRALNADPTMEKAKRQIQRMGKVDAPPNLADGEITPPNFKKGA